MKKRGTSERDNGELEFTRAADDAVRDAERSYDLLGVVMLRFDSQRGVMQLGVSFFKVEEGEGMEQVVAVRSSWPNANGNSFGAFLFQQCNKATQMAESWYQNQAAPAPVGSD